MVQIKYSDKRVKVNKAANRQRVYEQSVKYTREITAPFIGRYAEFDVISRDNHVSKATATAKVTDDQATGIRLGLREVATGAEVFTFVPKEGFTADYFLDQLGPDPETWLGKRFVGKVIAAKASPNKWGSVVTLDTRKSQFAK